MLKALLVSAVVVAGTSTYAAADMQTGRSVMTHHMHRSHVTANGRCNGRSYGTGQRSCGTATGGTPGGNPSRN